MAAAYYFSERIGVDAIGNYVIGREQEFHFPRLGLLQKVFREFDLVRFDQRLAYGLALRLEEGIGHAAADDEGVDFAQQILDDADFVAHFCAAENGYEGTLRIFESTAQILEFLFHEQAGGGFLDELRDADRRGMGAVGSSEGVVNIELGQLGQPFGKILVVGLFLGVEAEILEQKRLAFFQFEGDFFGFRSNAVGTEAYVFAAREFAVEEHA